MKPAASSFAKLATAALFALASSTAYATPPRATASATPFTRRSARPVSAVRVVTPPPPPVALQLGGLRIFAPIPRAAIVHAIARDAWPRLVGCAGPSPRVRGYVNVELRESADGLVVHLDGGPTNRDPALARCVRSALVAVELPPYEGETPPVSVSFDLAFAMPPMGVGPARGPRR